MFLDVGRGAMERADERLELRLLPSWIVMWARIVAQPLSFACSNPTCSCSNACSTNPGLWR